VLPEANRETVAFELRTKALVSPTLEAIDGEIAAVNGRADIIDARVPASAVSVGRLIAGRTWTEAMNTTSAFYRFAVGFNVPRKAVLNLLRIPVQADADTTKLRLRVWSRPLADGDITSPGATAPAVGAHDMLVGSYDLAASAVSGGLSATTARWAAFPVAIAADPSKIYFADIDAFGVADVVKWLSVGKGAVATNAEPDWPRGWYSPSNTTKSLQIFPQANRETVALEVYEDASAISDLGSPTLGERARAQQPLVTPQGLTASFPYLELARPSGNLAVLPASLTFDAPPSASTTKVVSLTYNGFALLDHQYARSVVVTRVSDSVVLTEGVDYALRADAGIITGLVNTAAFNVSVAYTGYSSRYDLVVLDPTGGGLSVVKGTDRAIDPEEYRPAVPSGKIALYSVLVYVDGTEIMPLHQYRQAGIKYGEEAEFTAWLEYCRACLPNTLKRARRGEAISLAGYGDSITNIGAGSLTAPNGNKDVPLYFEHLPSDTQAAISRFDGDQGLGAHIHIGWNWFIKSQIERAFGSAVTYYNYGVGGTTSGTGADSSGRYNALNPTRLNVIIAAAPNLVVLAFGMNETGSASTYANIRSLIQQFRAVGSEVLVMCPPNVGSYTGWSFKQQARWLFTHDEIVRAARDESCAYVPTYPLMGYDRPGAVSLSKRSFSTCNMLNHPGPAILKAIGDYAVRIFS